MLLDEFESVGGFACAQVRLLDVFVAAYLENFPIS